MKSNQFVLVEPTGKYFVNPSYQSWSFTSEIDEATKFDTYEEADSMKQTVDRAVASTYWDYEDVVPFPKIKPVK